MSFELSAVVPCWNEAEGLAELRRRLEALPLYKKGVLQIVLVDDGSSDATWEKLAAWAAAAPGVLALRLAGNHGNQAAILAGLAAASGAHAAVLDADLQDPPEYLETMLAYFREYRCEAVIGLKSRRSDGSALLSLLKDLATAVLPLKRGEGDFCAVTRALAAGLLRQGGAATPFRARRYRALRGLKAQYLPYERQARAAGSSKFDLPKLAALWWRIFKGIYIGEPGGAVLPPVAERVEARA